MSMIATSRRVGTDVAADDRQTVDARVRVDWQQAAPPGRRQAGGRALAVGELDLGDRSVRVLADRVDPLPEEQVAHRRVADERDVVDRQGIHRQLGDRVAQVPGDGAHQQPSWMPGVVMDPRHDVGAAEALRVFERRVGDLLAGLEVDQADDHGRGTEIDREAVNRPARAGDFFAGARLDDAIAVTDDGGIECRLPVRGRQVERLPFDAHLPAAHRVAFDLPGVGRDPALAGQPEAGARVEVRLARRRRREQLHAARDLDHAFLALALGDTGRRDAGAGVGGRGEERDARRHLDAMAVDGERGHAGRRYQSAAASSSRLTACATSSAEPTRSCGSLQRQCAR
jgi:hypothetical protein